MISRPQVLQDILNLYESPRYLEIGVATGDTFHALKAKLKVAVDPHFRFDMTEARQRNSEVTYHQITSDKYFASIVTPSERFEVIYLDGLHTSEQTLRDLLNAICYLADMGVIVIDDAIPNSYAASLPDRKDFKQVRKILGNSASWMGDIYRLVFFIETFMQTFSYNVVKDNHGQIVMWRARRQEVPERTIEDIGRLEYKALFTQRESLRFARWADIRQNLKDREPLAQEQIL